MIEVREYLSAEGFSPFQRWLDRLNAAAAARIATALVRIAQGNLSSARSVGQGVFEYRIDFGRDGQALVILIAGGSQGRQQEDTVTAHAYWADYKSRKVRET